MGNLLIKSRFLVKLYFMFIMAKTQVCSWSPNPNMNVKTVKKFCWDVSRTFYNELGSIEVVVRPNHDSLSDKGGDDWRDAIIIYWTVTIPWIERDDQEEKCLKLPF